MSNIVYVPEWCMRHIDSQKESLDSLDVDDVRKSIVSVVDVNNYLLAQCEFAKLIVQGFIATELPKNVPHIYESAYGRMLHSKNMDDEARLKVSLALQNPAINYEALGFAAGELSSMDFTYSASESGRVVYVVGLSSEPNGGDDRTLPTISRDILCNVLSVCHTRLRVNNGAVDKSSTLRENPVLSSFYVSTLLAR